MSARDSNVSNKPATWEIISRGLVLAGVVFYVLLNFIPGSPARETLADDNLENSWTQALHVAFVNHLQFGTDIIFTYGPWGFLARGYHPGTYLISVIAWTIFSVVYLWAGWRVARHFSGHWLVAAVWLAVFTLVASIPAVEDFNTRLMAWCVLLVFLHFFVDERPCSPLVLTLALLLGWLGLVKFTGLMAGSGLVGVIAADNVIRQKRFPWIVPAWLAGVVIFWIVAGQSLKLFGTFLLNSWRITSGYTEGMMSIDSGPQLVREAIYLLIAVLLCVLAGRIAWPRSRYFAIFPAAGLWVLLFLTFKAGFTRADGLHEPAAVMVLVLCAMGCSAVAQTAGKQPVRNATGLLVLTVVFTLIDSRGFFSLEHLSSITLPSNPASLWAAVRHPRTGYLKDEFDQAMQRNHSELMLPPMPGGVDLYNYNQALLFADPASYRPRPVFQSYSAYSGVLAQLNAEYLRSDHAAQNILFSVRTIDERYPSLDDGLSWPELLTRYDVRGPADGVGMFLMLTRATPPREYRKILISTVTTNMGAAIPVPAATNGPVWAEMDIQKTLLGKLAAVLYKPSGLEMLVRLNDHNPHYYRLIPGMADEGFVLSPLITNTRGFAALASGDYRQDGGKSDVQSFVVFANTSDGRTLCYQPDMTVRFYRLEYPWQSLNFNWPSAQ